MYTRQEAAQLRQEFWTAFGQYMAPVLSASGEKINWVNYKTGEKHIAFRMQADAQLASIAVEFSHRDDDIRLLYFYQLQQMKHLLEDALREKWEWQEHVPDQNRTISRVVKIQEGCNAFKKEDWPCIISFLKPRIMALDEFWSSARYVFEALK